MTELLQILASSPTAYIAICTVLGLLVGSFSFVETSSSSLKLPT
jgi:hypothetical protein